MSTLKNPFKQIGKQISNNVVEASIYKEKKENLIKYGNETILTWNTIGQIALLQIYKKFTNVEIKGLDFISDSVILILGNLGLNKISQTNTYLSNSITEIYYPLTSTLFFTAYNNIMYSASYVKTLSLIVPFTILEYYAYKKIYE